MLTSEKVLSFYIYVPPLDSSLKSLWSLWSQEKLEKEKTNVCPSEMLSSQVTLSTSDCIYLTRAVSSLQGSAVENTGEDEVAQGHPAFGPCFHSTHRMRRKWAKKIRCPIDFFMVKSWVANARQKRWRKRDGQRLTEKMKELERKKRHLL